MSPDSQLAFQDLRLSEVLITTRKRLSKVSDTAWLDAQVLVGHIIEKPRAWILAHPEESLDKASAIRLEQTVERIEKGEPLPYVLGRWEFYGLDFMVSPAVLIPRPETELLVETGIKWLAKTQARRVIDVGTGSGCIAVSIAVNNPGARVAAVDISRAALQIAAKNINRHSVEDRVFLIQSDLLTAFSSHFDLICANLPYIREEILVGLKVSNKEPELALAGGKDGLDQIRRFLEQASKLLLPGGMLLAEIEAEQGEKAAKLAEQYFQAASIEILKDLAGHDRLLRINQ